MYRLSLHCKPVHGYGVLILRCNPFQMIEMKMGKIRYCLIVYLYFQSIANNVSADTLRNLFGDGKFGEEVCYC